MAHRPMRFDILTTFPEFFAPSAPAALGVSIPARAHQAGLVQWHAEDIRTHTTDPHQRTDDRPFGGGPGMVMTCQPIWDAVRAVEARDERPARRVLMTPQGERLTQARVEELAQEPRILILCGRYEGIDQRVIDRLDPLELSIGDYVLSGGELAAMVLMDAIIRLLPGVLGDDQSASQDSFSRLPEVDPNGDPVHPKLLAQLGLKAGSRLLDCPHYTRPRVWEGQEAPEVLFSGDHGAVARWRLEQIKQRTRQRRPDLLDCPPDPERDQPDLEGGDRPA